MAVFPCKFSTPCLDPASPVQNLSAEASDGPDFLGLGFPFVSANNPIGGQGGGNFPPPFYFAEGCMNVCVSEISQADADLCAQRSAYICTHTPPPGGPPAPTFFFSGLQVCNITCPDGSIFSYRVLPGSFVATSQAEADQQASAYACAAAAFNLMCLSNIPNGCLNAPYSSTITTSERGLPPFVFTLTAGALPPGMALAQVDAVTALLSGTPTIPGNYSFTLRLTDANGNFMERTYSFAVMGIVNSPPAAVIGQPYSFQFFVSGGTPPYTFVLEGALPTGLSMSSSGLISGTTINTETDNFTVTVTDSSP